MMESPLIEPKRAEAQKHAAHPHLPASSHPSPTPRIVALLPRGEAIRCFVYNRCLDAIAQNAELTLFSVIPNPEIHQLMRDRYPEVLPLGDHPERRPVNMLRVVLNMAHGRWLWSKAAQHRWLFHDTLANTPWEKIKRAGYKAACYPFSNNPGLRFLSEMERLASKRLLTDRFYLDLFQRSKPDLVFNASHVHSPLAIQAVQAAQWLGIPTATFIFSWDNLTSQGRIIPLYDYYLVWNQDIAQQLLSIYKGYIRPHQVFVTGTPQFDLHFNPEFHWSRQEFCQRVGADPARPIILYSTGMANHMPGEPLLVERIAAMLREMKDLGPPQLLVRVYPKNRVPANFDDVIARNPDILFPKIPWEQNWFTPTLEDAYCLPNTLIHCAAGINIASTISLELCMFDKPVINIGYNPPGMDIRPIDFASYYDFDHYRPVAQSGAIQIAWKEEEMPLLIRRAITQPQTHAPRRHKLVQTMFGDTLDGQVGARIASLLLRLARNTPKNARA